MFSRFYADKVHPGAELSYEGLAHKAGGHGIDEAVFTGDENAIVDFRYSQSPKLTWWFDHHVSAFQQPGDEEHFRRDAGGKKFHDGARKSCTCFIADVVKDRYGYAMPEQMRELLHWAEIRRRRPVRIPAPGGGAGGAGAPADDRAGGEQGPGAHPEAESSSCRTGRWRRWWASRTCRGR